MIIVHVLYDKAVFLTNEEYYSKSGKRVNVQCHITVDGNGSPSHSHSTGPTTMDGNGSPSHSHSTSHITVDGNGSPSHSHSTSHITVDGNGSPSHSHSTSHITVDGNESPSHSHSTSHVTVDIPFSLSLDKPHHYGWQWIPLSRSLNMPHHCGRQWIPFSHSTSHITVDGNGFPSHSHTHLPDLAISLDTRIDYIHDTQTQGKEEHVKTKLSKVISKALGADKLVQDFDSIRHLIKLTKQQGRNVSHVHAHEHEVLRINYTQRLFREKRHLSKN